MYEVKTVDAFEDFINAKERSDFSDYSTKSKYWDNLNKLVVGIMTFWIKIKAIFVFGK